MALNKVEICGVNTSELPVLKPEEKEELFRRIKEGDKEAREQYIKGNLRLVLSVIRRFQNSNENADDLFQIGCIGLMKAIDNFDTTLQVKFSTYAVPMIIGEIRRYLRDNLRNSDLRSNPCFTRICGVVRCGEKRWNLLSSQRICNTFATKISKKYRTLFGDRHWRVSFLLCRFCIGSYAAFIF